MHVKKSRARARPSLFSRSLFAFSVIYAFPCVLETKADVLRPREPYKKSTNAQLEHQEGVTHWSTSLYSDQSSPLHTSCHSIPIRAPL